MKSDPFAAVPVKAKLTASCRDDGGEMIRVIVDSSPSFVITVGDAETLTDCASNERALKNMAIPNKTRAAEIDRVFMTRF